MIGRTVLVSGGGGVHDQIGSGRDVNEVGYLNVTFLKFKSQTFCLHEILIWKISECFSLWPPQVSGPISYHEAAGMGSRAGRQWGAWSIYRG